MHPFHRFNPLTSRLRPRFGLSSDIKTSAVRSWIVSPEVCTIAPSAIFEPDDLSKVTGVAPDSSSLASQFAAAHGGNAVHAATVAHELHDAVLARGHLFTRRAFYPISAHRAPLIAARATLEYSDAVLASSSYGVKYFGHWMTDDLPRLLAAKDLGHPVSILADITTSQRAYLARLQLQSDTVTDCFFKRIVVLDDFGQNAYKRRRYFQLREIVQRRASTTPPPGVLLLRGESGVRRALVNEREVEKVALERGFRVVDPSRATVEEILERCAGTSIVLGVEGSQLTNGLMWMAESGALVTLQPPHRFNMVLKGIGDCLGVRFAFTVGDAVGPNEFRIDVSALQRLLDRVS